MQELHDLMKATGLSNKEVGEIVGKSGKAIQRLKAGTGNATLPWVSDLMVQLRAMAANIEGGESEHDSEHDSDHDSEHESEPPEAEVDDVIEAEVMDSDDAAPEADPVEFEVPEYEAPEGLSRGRASDHVVAWAKGVVDDMEAAGAYSAGYVGDLFTQLIEAQVYGLEKEQIIEDLAGRKVGKGRKARAAFGGKRALNEVWAQITREVETRPSAGPVNAEPVDIFAPDFAAAEEEEELKALVEAGVRKVSGLELIDHLMHEVKTYVYGDTFHMKLAVLYALTTHMHETWSRCPYLLITAPTRESGKSILTEIIGYMTRGRFLVGGSMRPTIIYRKALNSACRFTMIVHEANQVLGPKADPNLVGLMNAGYVKAEAVYHLIEPTPDGNHSITEVPIYVPRIFNGRGKEMPDDTLSRCLVVSLTRMPQGTALRRYRTKDSDRLRAELPPLVRRWMLENKAAIALGDEPQEPVGIKSPRNEDNVVSILQVAEHIGPAFADEIRSGLTGFFAAQEDDEEKDLGLALLADLRQLFLKTIPKLLADGAVADSAAKNAILSDVTYHLHNDDTLGGPWNKMPFSNGPITKYTLGKLIKGFGVKQKAYRVGKGSAPQKGYLWRDIQPVFDKYLPPVHEDEALLERLAVEVRPEFSVSREYAERKLSEIRSARGDEAPDNAVLEEVERVSTKEPI
ncbi:DUF3631 domain-containing protein [Ruegeria sp. HKCCA5426]|uniref:DUF3631 domain-containing protein n=1 Tax=Ruegeria sp. HKCCA5426 TaxID=2682985 RepID=UPI001489FC0F|nr:DUF3631 domain-containing protein [Ruegeria sp. HKCCA5426]